MCLTDGELKSCLFFLLARSGSCFRFDIGQLLWFQSTCKNQRMKLISEVFLKVRFNSLSCKTANRVTLTESEQDYFEFKVAVDLSDGDGATSDILKDDEFIILTKVPSTSVGLKHCANEARVQFARYGLTVYGYLNQTCQKNSLFVRRNVPQETKI